MKNPLQFYVIDERTDVVKYCKARGLTPYKFKDLKCDFDGKVLKSVIQYIKDGYI